jgi:RNA polymerase sigma factor (sigma-70 family)
MVAHGDRRIDEIVAREQGRLRSFIRRRVADPSDVEDVLQDVFYELVAADRLMKPIDLVGAWLFRVARNRIVDLFRKKRPDPLPGGGTAAQDEEPLSLEEMLPSPHAGPEALYARRVLLDEIDAALDELPDEQRDVFVAHELQGRSFKQLSAETGLGVSTLLSRKHYAVVHLRRRLQKIYDEFTKSGGR